MDWVYAHETLVAGLTAVIAALIGFGGIIAAALYNAKLTRDRDDRLRREEARALAAAIGAELRSFMVVAGSRSELLRRLKSAQDDTTDWHVKSLAFPAGPVVDATIRNLGLLGPELSTDIVALHYRIQRLQHTIDLLTERMEHRPIADAELDNVAGNFDEAKGLAARVVDRLDSFAA